MHAVTDDAPGAATAGAPFQGVDTDTAAPGRAGARPVAVRLEQVRKSFGEVVAVAGVDLDVYEGEFFSLLGPSGSGKTTTLRMIAGFELPTSGRVLLSGQDVSRMPPFERDVNTVFQDYALFPHMTVGDNVAYGLMIKKVPRDERGRRVTDALRMVRLEGYEARKPAQLSGGQRQRVALARALINRPKVLLLDEPLGALDLKLRQEMQLELKAIQQRVGITFIYVTHDQEEALAMSDRLAVFNHGRIEQVGAPAEVYERPATAFVAGFVGTSNLLSGDVRAGHRGPSRDLHGAAREDPPRRARATRWRPTSAAPSGHIDEVVYLGLRHALPWSSSTSGRGSWSPSRTWRPHRRRPCRQGPYRAADLEPASTTTRSRSGSGRGAGG